MIPKLKENIWSYVALSILALALLSTRGGMAALGPMLKFVIPFAVVFLLFKLAKNKLTAKFQDVIKEQLGNRGVDPQTIADLLKAKGQKNRDDQRVIDLCPKCGAYLAPGHRCKTS